MQRAFTSRSAATSVRAPCRAAVPLKQCGGATTRPVVCKVAAVEVDYLSDVTLQSWDLDVLELDARSFHAFLQNTTDRLVVVDFFATWCGPCKVIAPYVEQLARSMDPRKVLFVKVDCQSNQQLAKELKIRSLPTFQVYRGPEKVSELTGTKKDRLLQLINNALNTTTSTASAEQC